MRRLFSSGEKRPQLEHVLKLHLSPTLLADINEIAYARQMSAELVLLNMVEAGVEEYFASLAMGAVWEQLTPRQQQVAALACLGHSNLEIGQRLSVSVNTVKTHMGNVLRAFSAVSKADLRHKLRDWDFEQWWNEVVL